MVVPSVLIAESVLLAVCLIGSAFFSLSETAFISADRLRIHRAREEGDHRAARVERIVADPERFITTILVGNNVVNIGASVLATVIAVEIVGDIGPAIAAGVMTLLILLFGEITPKTLAVRHAVAVSLLVARPILVVEAVLSPIVAFLSAFVRATLRLFGSPPSRRTPFITEEEITTMLRMGEEHGTIERFERRVITEVFEFTQTKAHRILTPRAQITSLPKTATLDDALAAVLRTGHSRVIVMDGDLDHVVGFLHAKDLLRFSDTELRNLAVLEIVRPVYFCAANTPTHLLLVQMQRAGSQIAIIQDDHGKTLGLVSLEDLFEELVGEIRDEFEQEKVARGEDPSHFPGAPHKPPLAEGEQVP